MDSSFRLDTINLGFQKKSFIFWSEDFFSATSVDPDEMQHNAAFHLGLHCLQKYLFSGSKSPSSVLINESVAIIVFCAFALDFQN